jgi:hypothetical protein
MGWEELVVKTYHSAPALAWWPLVASLLPLVHGTFSTGVLVFDA